MAAASGGSALADDVAHYKLNDDAHVNLAAGVLTGVAHEYVYDTDTGDKISELIWDLKANPSISAGFDYKLSNRWSIEAVGTVAFDGTNMMDDYDWVQRPTITDWTDHSWHKDTELDHFLSVDFATRYAFLQHNSFSLSALGGIKYTDVKWTAYGGCYLYSSGGGFRNNAGCFADGEKGISYNQMMPAVYAGLGLNHDGEAFDISASAVGGMTVGAHDRDNHWMRSLLFKDKFDSAPYLGLKLNAAYKVMDGVSLFAAGDYSYYFNGKGPTDMIDTTTGAKATLSGDASGGSLQTLNVSLGAAFTF